MIARRVVGLWGPHLVSGSGVPFLGYSLSNRGVRWNPFSTSTQRRSGLLDAPRPMVCMCAQWGCCVSLFFLSRDSRRAQVLDGFFFGEGKCMRPCAIFGHFWQFCKILYSARIRPCSPLVFSFCSCCEGCSFLVPVVVCVVAHGFPCAPGGNVSRERSGRFRYSGLWVLRRFQQCR